MRGKKGSYDLAGYISYNKRIFYAATITSIIFIGAISGLIVFKWTQPTVSTVYYHYNLQYRCLEDTSVEDICFAVANLVWMYGNHTNWHYTLEMQFMLLEAMEDLYPDVLNQIRDQNQNGQLELIVPQYSDAWHVPYPIKDLYDSVNYTRHRMLEMGLTPSRLIIMQEGQWLPGFPLLDGMGDFDAYVLHIEQGTYFNYYPNKPVLRWTIGGKTSYVLVNPRLPTFEGGYFHHQIYAADGELLNTGDYAPHGGPASEFGFNPEKQKNHEDKLIELEKRGNTFLTMEEFFDRMVANEKNIGDLTKYIPECEWVAAQYDQYFTWMGKSSSSTDDGALLAKFYKASQLIKATELLLNQAHAGGLISDKNYTDWGPYRIGTSDGLLLEAKKHLWEAQVSDTTGINPSYWEFWYGMNNSQAAIDTCFDIINKIRHELAGNPYESRIQINPYTQTVYNQTDSINFINNTLVDDSLLISNLESIFGFDIEINQKNEFNALGYTQKVERRNFNATDWNVEFYKLNLGFYGLYNLTIDPLSTNYIEENALNGYKTTGIDVKNDISVKFIDSWEEAIYSPAIAENITVQINRNDYFYKPLGADEWLCLLSMCNGLLYNPLKGYAIVKNCSAFHLPATWRVDNVEFKEIEVKYNSTRDFFFLKTDLATALKFANQINSYSILEMEAI